MTINRVAAACIAAAVLAPDCSFAAQEAKFIGAGAEAGRHPALVATEVVNAAKVAKAEWRVTGLGVVTPFVNDARAAGDEVLIPGFTVQRKRRIESTLDVTDIWRSGAGETNRLSALVTSGWWCDAITGWNGGSWPAFRGVLTLTYADGTSDRFVTDESWRVTTETPLAESGIYEGASFDARVAASNWSAAKVSGEFNGEITPRIGGAVVHRRDLAMKGGDFALKPGETKVVDFGQNASAVPRLRVKGAAGVKVTVRLGEMLNDGIDGHGCDGPKGSVYLANMRSVKAGFDFVCGGAGEEEFVPSETFFGYRYASISADGEVEGRIDSIPVTSVTKAMERGTVETGDESVNRLIKNAYWGMLSNYLSVPTDCPQRNERLGWAGDTQVFSKTGAYFADTADFMRKWMQDVRDTQFDNGVVPTVAPPGPFGGGGPVAGWSDAAVIVPWTIWKYTGDEKIVRENWEAMDRFVSYVDKTGYATESGGVLCDWLSFEKLSMNQHFAWNPGAISKENYSYQHFLANCHLLRDARMMDEMAGRLGIGDRGKYAAAAERAKSRIEENWLTKDGDLIELFKGMQTPALFALKLGLGDRAKISAGLVAAIHANGDRLATGFLGTPLLCEVLSEIGEKELAYTLLLQRKFPSWLYSIDQGATTMWERWDGYTKERGFGDVEMNSYNHYAYGAVVAWLFEHAAGIRPDKDGGWRNFTLAPEPDRRLGHLRATLRTEFGVIESAWEYGADGKCRWKYSVPEGCTATVVLPDGKTSVVQSGKGELLIW